MSVVRMCEVAGFSRVGYYRFLDPEKPAPTDMELRDAMQKIALEWPSYGSRRMKRELRDRGWEVNRKRVQRLMREDNLLCVVKRKFVVTTNAAHGRKVYPNVAGSMILTGVDQLWVADITYIRLEEEFVYLAVILDAYSRRVIGWCLSDGLDDWLTQPRCQWRWSREWYGLDWCITPTAGCSMPAAITRICCRRMASKSA